MNPLLCQRNGLLLFGLLLLVSRPSILSAQSDTVGSTPKTGSKVSFSGSARISGDGYWHHSTGDAQRQYPSRFGRIFLKPNLKIGSVSLPFRIALSTSSSDAPGQAKPNSSFLNGLTDPANSLGLSPKFGNTTVHLGTHVPELSGLIGSRVHIFGAGLELSPGNLQVRLSGGVSQRSLSVPAIDTEGNFSETLIRYNRTILAGRLALKNKERSFGLNVLYANDDPSSARGDIPKQQYRLYAKSIADAQNGGTVRTVDWNMRRRQGGNSIIQDSETLVFLNDDAIVVTNRSERLNFIRDITLAMAPTPEENLVASVDASFKLKGGVSIDAELAAATFTHNTNGRELSNTATSGPNNIEVPLFDLLPQRATTQFDGAGKITGSIEKDAWGLEVEGEYVGPGYVSAGFPYQTTDYFGLSLSPHAEFIQSRLRLDGFFEWRRNNLTGEGLSTMSSFSAYANALFQVTGDVSLNAGYSGFIHQDVNSPFPSTTIQQSLRFGSLITLPTTSATHSFEPLTEIHWSTNSWSADDIVSLIISGQYRFQLISPRTPLRLEVGGTYIQNWLGGKADGTESSEASGKFSIGYGFLDKRLQPRLYISHAQYGRAANSPAKRTVIGTGVRWSATRSLQLTLRVEATRYSSVITTASRTWDNSFTGTRASLSTNWRW